MLNIIVILVAFILSYFAEKYDNRKLLFCTFVWLSLCCGLRNKFLGNDTSNYISFFYDIKHFGIFYGSDIGFSFPSYILMLIFDNPYILLLIYSFVTHYFIIYRLWQLKKEASFAIMILIFSVIYYPYCFNIVRQFIAIALIFWATKYLEKKNYKKFILFNFIAITFHTTAIIGFLYLFFENGIIKIIKKYKDKVIMFLFLLILSIITIFSSNLTKYLSYFLSLDFNIHTMTIFKLFCALIICFFDSHQINEKTLNRKNFFHQLKENKYIIYYFIGLILSLSGMFYNYMNRIGFYFLMFEMPFWGSITFKNQKYKGLYYILLTFILALYLITTFI